MQITRFFDPIYGRVDISDEEAALLLAPEVQRLRYVRMCNINSLLISGASEISRFEHTVGVLQLAKIWTTTNGVSTRDARVIHAAAILHDMQTGPFGHSMEYVLTEQNVDGGFIHDDVFRGSRRKYFQDTSANAAFAGARFISEELLGDLWHEVAEVVAGAGRLGPIMAGTVDLDNIDNVVRLAYHAGAATRSDGERAVALVQDLKLAPAGLSISANGIGDLENWQKVRTALYRLLLEDPAEFSAKAMLTRMIEEAVARHIIGADSWVLTDDELVQVLRKESVGEAQEIGELAQRLLTGDLYETALLVQVDGTSSYNVVSQVDFKRRLERDISRIIGGGRVIFHPIKDKGKTARAVALQVRGQADVRLVGADSDRLLVGVFVSSKQLGRRHLSAVRAAVRGALGVFDEQLAILDDPVPRHGARDDAQLSLFDGA